MTAHILIIEDDNGVRRLLETLLEHEGFTVSSARDGVEGLLKVRMLSPAALVLDIMMPGVGGLQVLDELAAESPDLPVMVLTGKPAAADIARERLGEANVFDKPFDIDQLVARLREITAP